MALTPRTYYRSSQVCACRIASNASRVADTCCAAWAAFASKLAYGNVAPGEDAAMNKHRHGARGHTKTSAGSLVARLAQARAAREREASAEQDELGPALGLLANRALDQLPAVGMVSTDAAPAGDLADTLAEGVDPKVDDEVNVSDGSWTPSGARATEQGPDEAMHEIANCLDAVVPLPPAERHVPHDSATLRSANARAIIEGLERARTEIDRVQALAMAEIDERDADRIPTEVHSLHEAQINREWVLAARRQSQAELRGAQRRIERDRSEPNWGATGGVIMQIVPIIDDLERALTHVPEAVRDDAWTEGIRLIVQSMNSMLCQNGVARHEPLGEVFDPRVHEAISRVEVEEVAEHTVTLVYRPAYTMHGRLIRPAQVQVATRKDP